MTGRAAPAGSPRHGRAPGVPPGQAGGSPGHDAGHGVRRPRRVGPRLPTRLDPPVGSPHPVGPVPMTRGSPRVDAPLPGGAGRRPPGWSRGPGRVPVFGQAALGSRRAPGWSWRFAPLGPSDPARRGARPTAAPQSRVRSRPAGPERPLRAFLPIGPAPAGHAGTARTRGGGTGNGRGGAPRRPTAVTDPAGGLVEPSARRRPRHAPAARSPARRWWGSAGLCPREVAGPPLRAGRGWFRPAVPGGVRRAGRAEELPEREGSATP